MGGRGRGSGQAERTRREDLSGAPGYGGNAFPDSTGNHIVYSGGMSSDWDYDVDDEDAVIRDIRERFGVGMKAAMDDYRGVRAFTDYYYSGIRDAQKNGDTDGRYAEWGRQAEKYIADGIKSGNGWNGGHTYRGIAVDDDTLQGLSRIGVGENVNIHNGGSASWATDVGTARDFSHNGSGNNHVVFVNMDTSQRGVSVAGISSNGFGEHEVLCSKDNQYKKVGQYSDGNYTYIYVRNA